MSKETLGMIIGLCALGILYFGGQRLREAARRESLPKFKWGDAQRRDYGETPWWASDMFLCVLTFLLVGLAHVMLR